MPSIRSGFGTESRAMLKLLWNGLSAVWAIFWLFMLGFLAIKESGPMPAASVAILLLIAGAPWLVGLYIGWAYRRTHPLQ